MTIQRIGIRNLEIDHHVQSRVEMNMDYMREFTEAMQRGDVFPPVDVFHDGKTFWLADGFHRVEAANRAGEKDIRCQIHDGTWRDARIFSAGANKALSIPRTIADKNKAVRMLLGDDEWFNKSANSIAKHVGVSGPHVRKVRLEYCQELNLEEPKETTGDDGRSFPTTRQVHKRDRRIFKHENSWRFAYAGKEYNAGPDPKKAERMLGDVMKNHGECRRSTAINSIAQFLTSNKIVNSNVGNKNNGLGQALKTKTAIIVPATLITPGDVLIAGAQALFNRVVHQSDARAIVVCYAPPQCLALDAAKELGVEFVTPEELIEALKRGS